MKAARRRKFKRVDFAKLRDIKPPSLNESLIKKVSDKVGKKGIAKILDSKQGIGTIVRQLGNKLSNKEVSDIKSMLGEHAINSNTKLVQSKFFFPYRGAWFFDLIVNHKLRENPKNELVKYFGVFLNGNTGWVKAYEINSRSAAEIRNIFDDFINSCNSLQIQPGGKPVKYPVKKIISDNEGGVPNSLPGIDIVKKTQSGTSHGMLSRINSFASALRKYFRDKQYLTLEDLDEFIEVWNMGTVPMVRCSRNEMMEDIDLEEAYIAACMTENADVKAAVEEGFKSDDLVKVKETNDKFRHNPQQFNKEKTGTYKVISNEDGNITLENIHDPNDRMTTRAMNITKRVVSGRQNLERYLGPNNEVLPDVSNEVAPQVVVRQVKTPKQTEENRAEAQIHKNSKTVARANENKQLRQGEINFNNMTQKEITDIARHVVEREMDNDFHLGFLSHLTPAEKYSRMEEFANKLPTNYLSELFGDVEFYTAKKKNLGPRNLIKLQRNLMGLLEKPEFRDIWNDAKYEADENDIARALGIFVRNKPGPK